MLQWNSNLCIFRSVGNGKKIELKGRIKLIECIRPGVVGISWHFGHWAYGSNDVTVDGKVVKGDARRRTGINPNPLMIEDSGVGNVCLTDPIGGSASFFDTENVGERSHIRSASCVFQNGGPSQKDWFSI